MQMNELGSVLRAYAAEGRVKNLRIKSDRQVHVGRLVKVVDEVKLAGIKSFSIVTERGRKEEQ